MVGDFAGVPRLGAEASFSLEEAFDMSLYDLVLRPGGRDVLDSEAACLAFAKHLCDSGDVDATVLGIAYLVSVLLPCFPKHSLREFLFSVTQEQILDIVIRAKDASARERLVSPLLTRYAACLADFDVYEALQSIFVLDMHPTALVMRRFVPENGHSMRTLEDNFENAAEGWLKGFLQYLESVYGYVPLLRSPRTGRSPSVS